MYQRKWHSFLLNLTGFFKIYKKYVSKTKEKPIYLEYFELFNKIEHKNLKDEVVSGSDMFIFLKKFMF